MNIQKIIKNLAVMAIPAIACTPAADACTSLVAARDATADGSTLVTYAADSHVLYGYLQHLPAADHKKGDMREVREWDTNKFLGYIPEVSHTYSVIGNMNEHQVTIVESTWGGKPELVDTTGIIDYGSLIYIALQRSKTAREAIKVMTGLVEEYGYYSSGESFSIADPEEVWIMDMIGKGGHEKGAVWAAIRIPDDCIAGHANFPRIRTIPFDDKENVCIRPMLSLLHAKWDTTREMTRILILQKPTLPSTSAHCVVAKLAYGLISIGLQPESTVICHTSTARKVPR